MITKLQEYIRFNESATEEDYKMDHHAPHKSKDDSPLYDVTANGTYPEDIYTKGAHYYGDGEYPYMDEESINIIKSCRNKPNKLLTIYRAVPAINRDVTKDVKKLSDLSKHYYKYRFFPNGDKIMDDIMSVIEWGDQSRDDYNKELLNEISRRIDELNKTKKPRLKINDGDWVTINKRYAIEHGKSNLGGKYDILTKTVHARELYSEGNSIHEWGYSADEN